MSIDKTLVALVYYRELPSVLEDFINKNNGLSFNKDGVKKVGSHSSPRLTIRTSASEGIDKTVKTKLDKLLTELKANNQIVGFSMS